MYFKSIDLSMYEIICAGFMYIIASSLVNAGFGSNCNVQFPHRKEYIALTMVQIVYGITHIRKRMSS